LDAVNQSTGVQIFILHGDNHLEIQQAVRNICAHLGEPDLNSTNITRLDGRTCSADEILNAVMTLPFFSERRVVIMSQPPMSLSGEAGRSRFLEALDHLPPGITIICTIEDEWDSKDKDWHSLPKDHWLRKWISTSSTKKQFQFIKLPSQSEMTVWIQKQAVQAGGRFSQAAARRLAEHTGNDNRTANQEIDKLLTYVNYERSVEVDDVELLTAVEAPANIFEMVDALSTGVKPKALRLLHKLLEEQDPTLVFGMIIRQFRLLLMTREILDEGGGKTHLFSDGVTHSDFMANKLLEQAPRFSIKKLETIYQQLLVLDEKVKTSQMPLLLALDTFIVELSGVK
jgi:DNA polymerase III subunit delta